jgi:hypothetical protein
VAKLTIESADHLTHYHPGDHVNGFVGWELDEAPRYVELRLFWYTRGRGTRDAGIVAKQRWDNPPRIDAPLFDFELPAGPFSFSGKLVSVAWALELVAAGVSDVAKLDLVVSPTLEEIDLTTTEAAP